MRRSTFQGKSVISTIVSRWLLWLAARIAGPDCGSRSRWRTLRPSTISTIGRTTHWKKSNFGNEASMRYPWR